MWSNSTYVPNSTIDSLVIDRVVSLDVTNMGILCVIVALLSVIIFYVVISYMKKQPK